MQLFLFLQLLYCCKFACCILRLSTFAVCRPSLSLFVWLSLSLLVDCFLHLILHYFCCDVAVLISAASVLQIRTKNKGVPRPPFRIYFVSRFAYSCKVLHVSFVHFLFQCRFHYTLKDINKKRVRGREINEKCNKYFNGPNWPPTHRASR